MKLSNITEILTLSLFSSCTFIDRNIKSLEYTLNSPFSENLFEETYLLNNDEERMDALWKFYNASFDKVINDGDFKDNVVIIQTPSVSSHGYMIDDCGLILTSGHVARKLSYKYSGNDFVFDNEGNKYFAKRTELNSYYNDYAIIVAETGKPQKTNPLNFFDFYKVKCGSNIGFNMSPVIYNLNNFMNDSKTTSEEIEPFEFSSENGKFLCVEHALEHIVDCDSEFEKLHLGRILESQIRRGFYFVTSTIKAGYSGSPVFNLDSSGNPIFIGLVQGSINKGNKCMENFGFVTGSDVIFDALKNYLYEYKKFDD